MNLEIIKRESLPCSHELLSIADVIENLDYVIDEHNKMVVAVKMLLAVVNVQVLK